MADKTTNNKIITTVKLDVGAAQQEIVKLNSLASDGTQELSARLDAKNKQIKIQNELNKKSIKDLEKQVKGLTGVEGKEKDLIKATQKLEKAKLNEVKVTERNAKSQRKLADSYGKSKGAMNKLDNATGGFITRLKALAANPIVLVITLMTGALLLLKEAFTSSEEGQNRYAKATAIVGTILGNLLDIVADVAEFLVDAFTSPVESLKSFSSAIKENIINRFEGLLELIPALGKAIGQLFSGDFSDAAETAGNAFGKVALGVEDISGKLKKATENSKEFFETQKREAKLTADVADKRAKADKIERRLIVERSQMESKIAQLRLDAKKEEDFTDKQRKAFLVEAAGLQDNLIGKETEYLILRRDAQILENTFSRSNKENLTKEAEAIAAVNNQIGARATKAKKLQTEINSINNQIRADDLKTANAILKSSAEVLKFQESLTEKKKLTKDEELAAERESRLLELESLQVNEAQKNKLKLDIEAKYKADKAAADLEAKLTKDALDFEAQLELDTIELERLRKLGEDVLAIELELIERKREQDVSGNKKTAKQIELIDKKASDAKKKIKDAERESTIATDKAILESGINMAADAFGIAQEVALAKMIMAAPEAIGNVWSQAAKQPTIPQMLLHGAVGTATTLKPIIQGISSIKNTKFSKKKGGTPSGSVAGIASAGSGAGAAGVSAISDISSNNASRVGTDTSLSSNATSDAMNSVAAGGSGNQIVFSESSYSDFQNQIKFKEDKSTI